MLLSFLNILGEAIISLAKDVSDYQTSVDNLDISLNAREDLQRNGITSLGELKRVNRMTLAMSNIHPYNLREIENAIQRYK